jgi:hypothetical protein
MEALYKKYLFCQNFLLMMIFSTSEKIYHTIELLNDYEARESMGECPFSQSN